MPVVAPGLSTRSLLAPLLLAVLSCIYGVTARADGESVTLSRDHAAGDQYMGIRLLGALDIGTLGSHNTRLAGLSALAWDEDAQVLHALSDLGEVFRLRPAFADGILVGVTLLGRVRLRGANGRLLSKLEGDSEGLALEHADNGVVGDTLYVVSFEIRPRIDRYTPQGRLLGTLPLPADLQGASRYSGWNNALESVAIHPLYGHLTAPEQPLREDPAERIRIFSLRGPQWWWPRGSAPNSAVVAVEALHDGRLLVLERAYTSPLRPLVISIRRTTLALDENRSQMLSVQDLAVLNSSDGWYLDNFEGLTHHRDSRFFMVSDNNGRALQRTLLVYFETFEDARISPDG